MSKSHLDNLLKLEKQKVDEYEKEVLYLREQSASKGADTSGFSLLDELRKVSPPTSNDVSISNGQ